jgi:transposase-like protein
MYLWRAVDHEGEILDMLVQRRRDTQAALRLMRINQPTYRGMRVNGVLVQTSSSQRGMSGL